MEDTGPTTVADEVADAVAGWPYVTVRRADGEVRFSAAGRVFATVTLGGVELHLPPRVRDMLVETGRATALPHPHRALLPPGPADPDLLRLAYERARIAAGT